ncbi:LytR/AlgR family response regulator transcription factor [Spirosoma spitsbergense]|jgi:two-component system LytT family response regulator|uniref:LytR/AlgR family response regulator transcription factor n=1 Tax=Spirosoma spitsbergense TaxID=431554 RepID=UPI000379A14C|nr:LytTR family DNA-binding domain-containing protein [Spirosoma spitsbergense]
MTAKPLTAIAIDDEPQALEVIKLHAAKVPFLEIKARFTDAIEAIAWLQTNRVDLLFLDIKMPDILGTEVVNCLPKPPMVIFTTAYSDFAVQGFELDAVDYLLKPFSLARFLKACTKALDLHTLRSPDVPDFLFVKTGYEEEKVRFDDILYIEAEGNYLSFVLPNRKLLSRQTMADLIEQLPPDRFIRVHRSFCVAIHKIDVLGRQEITLGSHVIPIGASYEDAVTTIRTRLNTA